MTAGPSRQLACLLCAMALWWLPAAAGAQDVGIVQVPRLNLRASPDVSGTPVAVLDKGSEVRVIGHRGGWVEVIAGEHRGFIRNREQYIRIETRAADTAPAVVSAKMAEAQAQASAIAERIETSRTEVGVYTAQEENIIVSLDGIERAVADMKKQVSASRQEMAALDEKMEGLRSSIAKLQSDLARHRDTASKRLVAYYKLSWMGRLQLLATAETIQDLFHRERALSAILDADARLLQRMADDRDRLASENRQLAAGRQEKAALEAATRTQLETLAADKSRRADMLREIRQKKTLEVAAIAALEQSARDLDRALEAMAADVTREAARAATAGSAPAPAGQPFSQLKGLLPVPVNGNIVNSFGEYRDSRHNVVNFRSGVDIRADYGEPIHAVSTGKVMYAAWFKGFGNMLIIDHGDHYYTVYAHLEETFKQKGDPVDAGEVIATVGDTGSLVGPKLYFEVRHHGKPMDPADWIKKG